eukprot:CAMPEP_0114163490 /NCGR_PEP_ID=MMETSP0043_2-20121206/30117_1 /TAXON_ID=464988 /ORGANISM="Hemiselmis andersenii, Strain CCMP644" /LENGTH=59 /DNA_ID=CAMNT_0001259997 /DNA_START=21 /DNA_END=197 /DNA_ORIENTATION=+
MVGSGARIGRMIADSGRAPSQLVWVHMSRNIGWSIDPVTSTQQRPHARVPASMVGRLPC